ncbi:MAG TPA: hypothetical protein VFF73_36660, partial [Planctomycetota bacterium]|nr:hypothetical protein [Planctomycetota bacterium]
MDESLRELERRLRAAPGDPELKAAYRRALRRVAQPVPSWLAARVTEPADSFTSDRPFEVVAVPPPSLEERAYITIGRTPGAIALPPGGAWGVQMPELSSEDEVLAFLDAVHEERIPGVFMGARSTALSLKHLDRVPDLAWLALRAGELAEAELAPIGRLRHLRKLDLANVDLETAEFLRSGQLEELAHFDASGTGARRAVLGALRTLPSLVWAHLAEISLVSVNGFAGGDNLGFASGRLERLLPVFEVFPRLEAVAIHGIEHTFEERARGSSFTEAVSSLRRLTQLKSLAIRCDELKLHPTAVASLVGVVGSLTALSSLDLSWIGLEDGDLAALAGLTRLRVLRLRGDPDPTERTQELTRAGLQMLAGLHALEELDLGGTRAGDDVLGDLAGLENLRLLSLDSTEIGRAGLRHLRNLPRLRSLDVRHTFVAESEDLQPLTMLPELSILRWGTDEGYPPPVELVPFTRLVAAEPAKFRGLGPWATDEALGALLRAGRLEGKPLDLSYAKVTDEGIKHLAGLSLPELSLSLYPDDGLTHAAIESLQRLRSVAELTLAGGKATALEHVPSIPGLQRVAIDDMTFGARDLVLVREILRRGIRVNATRCHLRDDADSLEIEDPADVIAELDLESIKGKTLALRNFGALGPETLEAVSREGEGLERLDLTGCRGLGDAALEFLDGMPELK